MKNETKLNLLIAAGSILIVALLMFGGGQSTYAAPPAAPTPIANAVNLENGRFLRFQTETAFTADTNTNVVEVMNFDTLDVSITLDEGTTNEITITVQYSNDNSNWDNGIALLSNQGTDITDITRVPVFGRYMRLNQDVTNTNTVTTTILAVGR